MNAIKCDLCDKFQECKSFNNEDMKLFLLLFLMLVLDIILAVMITYNNINMTKYRMIGGP